jgi:hypothetical protein
MAQDPSGAGREGGILICGHRPEAKGLEVVWCCSYSDDIRTAR